MSSLSSFDTPFSFEKTVNILKSLSLRILPDRHPVLRMIEERQWLALATASVNYDDFLEASEAKAVRQVLAFFQKNVTLPLGIDRKEVARQKLVSTERSCRVMNWRIKNRRFDPGMGFDAAFLFDMQCKIASILGPAPSLDRLQFGFGPGANVGTKRLTSARAKMSTKPTYTADAAGVVDYLREEFPHWDYLQDAVVTDYGKLSFVPKDAKTDRPIETQPIVNSFVQLGVGKYLKQRLQLAGCDLSQGQAWNADLAWKGSIDGSLATLDLSSASDTISSLLVLELLPLDWVHLLSSVRTPAVKFKGDVTPLERFSAMGNGYTFELETLIFFAVCEVVGGSGRNSVCHVYGDDIIVETTHAPEVIRRLEACGFTVNNSKSYVSGRFRESCGKDFFDGVDIRPCYVKEPLSYKELFRLHNFFFRRGMQYVADECLRHIPKRLRRITGPDGYGDGHLLSFKPQLVPHGRSKGWSGWTFCTHTKKPREERSSLRGDYAAFLYGNQASPDLIWEEPRESPYSRTMYQERGGEGYRLRRVYTLRV